MRRMSKKRQREMRGRRLAVEDVVDRDGGCVAAARWFVVDGVDIDAGPCFGRLTAHELRKRSQGGDPRDVWNCSCLCSGHNSWVEDEPAEAHALGLVVRGGESVADARARQKAAGVVGRGGVWWT